MKKMWFNGDIVTMANENEIFDCVITENNKIINVGKYDELKNILVDEKYDLNGKTILPAFIDPHSHFSYVVIGKMQVDLNECKNFKEIRDRINNFIDEHKLKKGTFINTMGYDQNILEEGTHPRKWDIDCDERLKEYPIILTHVSGHMGVFNEKCMQLFEVNSKNCDEFGEVEKKNGVPTGFMIETPFINRLVKAPKPTTKECLDILEEGSKIYLKNGIATVQEGLSPDSLIEFYKSIEEDIDGKFKNIGLEYVLFPDISSIDEYEVKFSNAIKKYSNTVKIGGVKIISDGSPQGRSAWMREPYLKVEETDDINYCGISSFDNEKLYNMLNKIYNKKLQPIIHVNGDAACQQYIDVAQRMKDEGKDLSKLRPVMIHAQFLGLDQLKKVKELGFITSFFVAHVYYWGDVHIKNTGINKASKISPAMSAIKENIMYTFHQDTPVIQPNMIETIWSATNRLTKTGKVLGEDEKISVYDALKGITINAAYQYFEEDIKGSIEIGKQADFVILDKNPLKINIEDINKIQIIATIKNSKIVYENKN